MSIPAGVETVTVTDGGVPLTTPDGTPLEGHFDVTGPDLATVAEDDFLFGGTVRRWVNGGRFDPLTLIATDAGGANPAGFTYAIEFTPRFGRSWTRYFQLPKAAASVVLAGILIPDPVAGSYTVLADPSTLLTRSANLADLADPAQARGHLGLGTAAVADIGSTPGTVAAGDDPRFSSAPAWRFDVTEYGAKSDAVIVTDGAVTAGSVVLTCATSRPFRTGDVGKSLLVQGAGVSGVTAWTATVARYNGPDSVNLSAAPPVSVSGAIVVFGTNNYSAIRQANQAAIDYRAAGHPYSEVYTPPTGGYVLDGPLDTSLSGNALVPFGVDVDTGQKKAPHYCSDGPGSGVRHWNQLVPQISGATWISFGFYSSVSAQNADISANGNPAIIGGPNEGTANGLAYGVGTANGARFSNTLAMISNMAFLVPHTADGLSHGAFNFYGCASAIVRHVSVSTLGVVPSASDYTSPGVFGTGLSMAALMPAPGNNDQSLLDDVSIQGGFTYGVLFSEHTLISRIMVLYCWSALCPVGTYAGSVGAQHSMRVLSASVEACTREVYFIGAGSAGVGPIVDMQISTESSTPTIDGNSVAALLSTVGEIVFTGSFNPDGVNATHPTGLRLINGQAPRAIRTRSASFNVLPLDRTLLCDTTAGTFTATLPDADVNATEYTIRNTGANPLTVATTGGQTVYPTGAAGSTTMTVAARSSARFQAAYNGTAWAWYAV